MIKGITSVDMFETTTDKEFGMGINPITGGSQAPSLGVLPTGGFKPSKVLTPIPTDDVIVGVVPNEPIQTVGGAISNIVEPEIFDNIKTSPIKDGKVFDLENPQGGVPKDNGNAIVVTPIGSTSGVSESVVEESNVADLEPTKKKFPYLLVIALAVVGGYFVFRKK
jgi:hypothetical protein